MEKTDNKTPSDKLKSKQHNYGRLGGLAFQLLAVIGIGTWFGYWLDNRMQLQVPIFTFIWALVSLVAVIVYLIKQIKEDA